MDSVTIGILALSGALLMLAVCFIAMIVYTTSTEDMPPMGTAERAAKRTKTHTFPLSDSAVDSRSLSGDFIPH